MARGKISSSSLGSASVATSQSLTGHPRIRSRTHPPTIQARLPREPSRAQSSSTSGGTDSRSRAPGSTVFPLSPLVRAGTTGALRSRCTASVTVAGTPASNHGRPMATSAMAQPSIPQQAPLPVSIPSSPPAAVARPATSRRLIFIGAAAVVAAGALTYWWHSRQFEGTDDAQIDGTISNVGPRVAGTVTGVYVIENQVLKAGDVIAEIDPTDLRIAVDQARAQVAQAQAQLEAEDPNVPITLASNLSAVSTAQSDLAAAEAALSAARTDVQQLTAQIAQAEANDRQAQLERERSQKLVAQGAVSQADYDQRFNAAAATSANRDALQHSLAGAKDRVAQQQAQLVALQSRLVEVRSNAPRQMATRKASVGVRQAAFQLATAQLAQAEKNLSYAKVVAPVTGIVAKKSVAVGDYISPGQQIVAIAQTDGLYVTADY